MIIVTDSQKLQYELSNVARMFFPTEDIRWIAGREDACKAMEAAPGETAVIAEEMKQADGLRLAVRLLLPDNREMQQGKSFADEPNRAFELGKLLYRLLNELTGKSIDWGVLTGIRPVKLARKLRTDGKTPDEIEAFFANEFLTTPQKAALCRVTDHVQRDIIASALPHGYSLYVSIPFCPSRCSYCSFVSHSIEKTWKLLPEYLDKLCIELAVTARLAAQKGMILQTVYVGGGTPTVFSAQQLETLLATITGQFDLSRCTEFTVEAGRPDTITADKLEVMRRFGVDRISVNCQTLSDSVLERIGRKHTAQQFLDAYSLVKQYGFTAINVDLIAGLPGDSYDSFLHSVEGVLALAPNNITVHSLAVKRAARLAAQKQSLLAALPEGQQLSPASAMVNISQQLLAERGYRPYYLYRQKGTVDSLENVGFCLPGSECRYNIFIMDETHTILAAGGGGVTKLVMPNDSHQYGSGEDSVRIERIFNCKYPYEYLEKFDTMLASKQTILDFPNI